MSYKTCQQCGAESPADAVFCGSCGSAFTPNEPAPAKPIAPEREATSSAIVPPPGHLPYEPAQETMPTSSVPTAQAGPYGPPAYGQQSGTAQPGVQQYFQQVQGDGNNSGMGMDYPLPLSAQGWTWAGFIPYGLFAFLNGNIMWGIFAWLPFLSYIYPIYVGIKGKEMAWKGRRFLSEQQFAETMRVWNTWGLWLFIVGMIGTVVVGFLYAALIVAVVSEGVY